MTNFPNNHLPQATDNADQSEDVSDLVVERLDARDIWAEWNSAGLQGQRRPATDHSARHDVESAD